jgi:D-alanyl-D-alanine carboxypeptidase (penicillin-binding protein 5/6)
MIIADGATYAVSSIIQGRITRLSDGWLRVCLPRHCHFELYMKFLTLLAFGLFACTSISGQAAESYLVMEANSGRVLLAYNTEKKRPVAGLTKVAATRVALDWANLSGTSLSTYISVPQSALLLTGPNPMQLVPGDRILFRDALYAALLGSDSFAAHTLAVHVGQSILFKRQIQGDAHKTFVYEMNQLAKSLGMRRTRFTDVHGLDAKSRGYSTASDIARLSVHVMRDVGFAFYVKQPSRQVAIVNISGEKRSYLLKNDNSLLGTNGVNGTKTGMSAAAGQCVSLHVHRSPVVRKIDDTRSQIRKRDLVVVVLGSDDRIARSKELISQAWPLYDQWATDGFIVSAKRKELLTVPRL